MSSSSDCETPKKAVKGKTIFKRAEVEKCHLADLVTELGFSCKKNLAESIRVCTKCATKIWKASELMSYLKSGFLTQREHPTAIKGAHCHQGANDPFIFQSFANATRVQYRAVPCRAVPCRAVPCRAVPCRAVPCRAVPCRAVPCRASRTA